MTSFSFWNGVLKKSVAIYFATYSMNHYVKNKYGISEVGFTDYLGKQHIFFQKPTRKRKRKGRKKWLTICDKFNNYIRLSEYCAHFLLGNAQK